MAAPAGGNAQVPNSPSIGGATNMRAVPPWERQSGGEYGGPKSLFNPNGYEGAGSTEPRMRSMPMPMPFDPRGGSGGYGNNMPKPPTPIQYDGTGMPMVNMIDDMGDFVPPHLREIDNQRRISNGEAPRTDYGPDTLEAYNVARPENFQVMEDNNRRNAPPSMEDSGQLRRKDIYRPTPQPMPIAPRQSQQGFNINQAAAQGLQGAMGTAAAETSYRPMEMSAALVGQQGYRPDTLAGQDLSAYTNPYENQVVQQSLDDLERSRLMAQNVGGAQAGAANAFGGSRQGIAEAETNRAYADQAARTASGLRQSGYMNAQQQAQQDIANRNQASQFGASASNQAGQLNQSAINQMRLANQNAGLSGSQQRLNAGQQLGNLSNLGFGMGQQIQGRMDQQGAAQQNLQQQIINAAKGQYGGFTGAPNQSLQALLAAVGGAPAVGSQTSGYTPGLFDYLSLGAGVMR